MFDVKNEFRLSVYLFLLLSAIFSGELIDLRQTPLTRALLPDTHYSADWTEAMHENCLAQRQRTDTTEDIYSLNMYICSNIDLIS